ncbi:cysteine desulfurase [Candidatus Cerribacteria bacterium 'Amazon FNV 2010 28 9']|uniref:Cysteine desulfurase n=1 Tax=Candidatus Cerribacteria bacterium 'Amazon FNV 2010 28 9' TaxID=2081795 RepID=A0A317JNZ7_9BACT|nr:MAG: cysteine desulfurase [Candidatus Cerribacteria bacterium 'Amazon FNV 2010 28 9']
MFDPHMLQQDFPILSTPLKSGKKLIYLDNAATSQKPQVVIDAITQYYKRDNANVHRGIHELGDRSTRSWHEARKTIATFFGATPEELVMTRNTTEGLNMVAYSYGEACVREGDLILTTVMDHHSNQVPWQELARRKKARLEMIPVTREGMLDLEWLERKVKVEGEKVKIVAFPHVSNTLGTLNPVEKIVRLVRAFTKAVIALDAAQSAPHLLINFDRLGVDFMAVSAHKMLGPMGIGALFIRQSLLENVSPWLFGGGMIGEVTKERATFADDLEDRFTAGTPDVAGAVGWAAACEYLSKLDMKKVEQHDKELVNYTLEKLQAIPEVEIVGPVERVKRYEVRGKRCGSVAFLYKGVHAHDVAQVLDSEGVAVRSGHHCTMPLHAAFGWAATTRVSFNVYTSKEDIDVFVRALGKVKEVFEK